MIALIDTSVLIALKAPLPDKQIEAQRAVLSLDSLGWQQCITPQVMMEYWSVATRPAAARGGLGLTVVETDQDIAAFLRRFRLLHKPELLFPTWWEIVRQYNVCGRHVWDARLAALAKVYDIGYVLTFNTSDFQRFDFLNVIDAANPLPR